MPRHGESTKPPGRTSSDGRTPKPLRAVVSILLAMAGPTCLGAAPSPTDWRADARQDLASMADAIDANYIYARYPDPVGWHRDFVRKVAEARSELPRVEDEYGYRAVLQHFAAGFHDAHLRLEFSTPEPPVLWPGFFARFAQGAIRVAGSTDPGVGDDQEVPSCDGRPIGDWIETIAEREIGLPAALETTRMYSALRLFIDRRSPIRARPTRCVIGGRDMLLSWRPAPLASIAPAMSRLRGRRDGVVSTRAVGRDGAWVTLGYFAPEGAEQTRAFHQAIADAEGLRDKRFIVLDVRGNGGGPYNWFMAYLRGLYGERYADHFATARLRIRGVYRLSERSIAASASGPSRAAATSDPPDPPFESRDRRNDGIRRRAIAAGAPYYRAEPIRVARSATAPTNPVRARVYVLTDYACGSACIAFVDELKLFPGVTQMGLPTYVDSRSGTAVPVPLPGGRARLFVATMTRDGRARGDNVPQIPSIRFDGDISDDAAVERWVLDEVVQR